MVDKKQTKFKRVKQKKEPLNLNIPPELKRKIEAKALVWDKSLTDTAIRIFEEYLSEK